MFIPYEYIFLYHCEIINKYSFNIKCMDMMQMRCDVHRYIQFTKMNTIWKHFWKLFFLNRIQ